MDNILCSQDRDRHDEEEETEDWKLGFHRRIEHVHHAEATLHVHQLASNPGRVYSRQQLLDLAFGNDVVVVDRNIDVHIRAIRKKINADQVFIETVRGVGYRFMDQE